MRSFIIITALAATMLFMPGCKKDFLELQPKNELTEKTTFSNYENVKTYAWQFYEAFEGYNQGPLNSETNGDLFQFSLTNSESNWIWQRITVPSASGEYSTPFARIRSINIMLDNLETSPMTEADKKHWRSVGYFFKAYQYANLVNKYGDITWVENALNDQDQETLFAARTPRNEVSQKILDLLVYAEANIKPAGDGHNTINVHVVRALISRFGLIEGTWRKYHALGDESKYLEASMAASEKLIAQFPGLHSNYDEVFNSLSLKGVAGILLYKQYEQDQLHHFLSYLPRTSSGRWDLTKKAVDMYLMKDGQTRWTSPLFAGDQDAYAEFRNRDKRLYYTVIAPYKVVVNTTANTWTHTTNPADREYIDLMAQISDPNHKRYPNTNWQGLLLKQTPHFQDFQDGRPFNVTYTGYHFYKFTNYFQFVQQRDINDAPVFRMGEVLLNYAEAKFELGGFNQAIAEQTINKLRSRGGVAGLNMAAIPVDPTRDPAVDAVLWEIRRERAIELMGDGFRFDDLRRWKKMDYATNRKLGRWIVRANYGNKIPTVNNAAAGNIAYEGVPPTPYPTHYYLYPLPNDQIVLTNGVIKQNPGWQ